MQISPRINKLKIGKSVMLQIYIFFQLKTKSNNVSRNWRRFSRLTVFVVSLAACLSPTSLTATERDIPRYNYDYNKSAQDNGLTRFISEYIKSASKEELIALRKEIIWPDSPLPYYKRYDAHVSVLFDITDFVPKDISYRELNEIESVIVKKLVSIPNPDSSSTNSIHPHGASRFHIANNGNEKRVLESINLYLSREQFSLISAFEEFVDIDLMGVSNLTGYQDGSYRFSPSRPYVMHEPNPLKLLSNPSKSGYYLEIKQAFKKQETVKIHVVLRNNIPTSVGKVLSELNGLDIEVIDRTRREFIATLDEKTFDILIRNQDISVLKDLDYHRYLLKESGKWRPYPLSELRLATSDEIIVLSRPIKTNLHRQGHEVIETLEQLDVFIELLESSPFNNKRKLIAELDKYREFDFRARNLVVLSHVELSGSNSISLVTPQWVNDELTLSIDRYTGGLSTQDIVDYSIFLSLGKEISKLVFRDNRNKQVVINKNDGFSSTKKRLAWEHQRVR